MIGFQKRKPNRNSVTPPSVKREVSFEENQPEVDVQRQASPTAQQIGALLRQSREQQALTLGEMSRKTRIRDVYLHALEEGEMQKLPGSTFVAGFLRLYAECLELKEKELIERYLLTSNGGGDALQIDAFPTPMASHHRPSVRVVLVGVVSLLGLFFFYEHFKTIEDFVFSVVPEVPNVEPKRSEAALTSEEYPVTFPAWIDPDSQGERSESVMLSDRSNPSESQDAEMQAPPPEPFQTALPAPVSTASIPSVSEEKVRDVPPVVPIPSDNTPPPTMVPSPKPIAVAEPPPPVESKDPAVAILDRYPEPVVNARWKPQFDEEVTLFSTELVGVQILDAEGRTLKDMLMQPDQLFRVPVGGKFFAILESASAIRLRVGSRFVPPVGKAGEVVYDLDLSAEALLGRINK